MVDLIGVALSLLALLNKNQMFYSCEKHFQEEVTGTLYRVSALRRQSALLTAPGSISSPQLRPGAGGLLSHGQRPAGEGNPRRQPLVNSASERERTDIIPDASISDEWRMERPPDAGCAV